MKRAIFIALLVSAACSSPHDDERVIIIMPGAIECLGAMRVISSLNETYCVFPDKTIGAIWSSDGQMTLTTYTP